MGLHVRLLGQPQVFRNGQNVTGRGRKIWGLLAYLLLSELPKQRTHLAQILFAEANDPMRALRWNLTELRHILGDAEIGGTDEVVLSLPPRSRVDAIVLATGSWAEAIAIPDLGRDLLEGFGFSGCPSFESWLTHQRRYLNASSEAALTEAALARLASGDAEGAIATGVKLVSLDPLNEEHQAVLIRCYAASGDRGAAFRQASAYSELCKAELGVEPGPAIISAMQVGPISVAGSPITGPPAVRAQLQAGRAAVKAGALEAGLECLRRAVAEVDGCGDLELKAEALVALGSALAHGGRERHGEGAVCLHAALETARQVGSPSVVASSQLELAWIDFMAARYERAILWLDGALEDGKGDGAVECTAHWIRGKCAMEMGQFDRSRRDLGRAVELAGQLEDPVRRSFCFTSLGRTHLLNRDLASARKVLDEAVAIAEADGFNWVIGLPLAFLGEIALIEGDLDRAQLLLERAYASAHQVGDRSFEGIASRGLALLDAKRGRHEHSLAQLEAAYLKLAAQPDCEWAFAYVLDGLCSVAVEAGAMDPRWLADLESVAARTGMRQMLVHVYLYRHRLGIPGALDTALALASEIDNDYLHRVLMAEQPLEPAI